MNQITRILFVSDSSDEVQKISDHLKSGGLVFSSRIVSTKKKYNEALLTFSPAILISDYKLREFDGMEALRIRNKIDSSVSFILLSDPIGEEAAVDFLKEGADDFVLQGNLTRLENSVKRLLDNKRRQSDKQNSSLEAEFEKTRMLFDSLLEHSPFYIFFKDKDSKIIRLSKNFEEIFGIPAEDVIGKNMYELFPEKIAEKRMDEDRKILISNTPVKLIEEFDGKYMEVYKFPIKVPGTGTCIAGIITDITERKKAENELKKERNLLRKLIDNIPELINIKDSSGKYIINNLPHMRSVGVERQEDITGKTPFDFFPAEEAMVYTSDDKRVIESGIPIIDKEECSMQKDTMSLHWYITSKIPLTDSHGKVTHLITVSHDITDRKKSQEIIAYERNLLRTLIDNLPDIIYIKDSEGRKIIANKADVENTGSISEADVIGKTDLELFPDPIGQRGYNDDLSVLKKGEKIINKEEDFIDRSGRRRWILTTKLPLYDDKGNIKGLIGIGRDITSIKEATLELIKAKEKAEESDKLKTAFLNNISHEIRTPMNAIVGFSSLLKESELTEEEKKSFIEIIIQSSNHLLKIINDIIEISHIEAGIKKVTLSETDLNSLMSNILLQFSKKTEDKDLEIKFSPGLTGQNAVIITDCTKLTQILINLISNSLKFTVKGIIEFGYSLNEEGCLQFFVSDTGIGIPPEKFDKIFERFYQIDNILTRKHEGTGLGLAISKGLVELLGGRIWLESEPGKGTVFYFTLPYKKGEAGYKEETKTEKILRATGKSLTLLVAEDDINCFNYIKALFSKSDINLIHTLTGRETIEAIKSGLKPDMILMDLKMPDYDGYEVTSEIKKIQPEIPVIALTAYTLPEEKEKALNAGCSDFISKPVEAKELILILDKYLKIIDT